MLVTLKEMLADARANHYAVPAFDVAEDVMVRTVLETAQHHRAPVILMCLPTQLQGNGWAYLPGLIKAVADHHDIPIALHLDHAVSLDPIKRAVDSGFSSVMIDGSQLPFEQNVEITATAAQIAHPHGLTVEGEIGHVGGMDIENKAHSDSVLTQDHEVIKFIEQTNVDALAISIGTAHGVYRSLPNLNIPKLKELNDASPVPLVLHGGSGTPDDQIIQAVKNGITKLNIFADQRLAMFRGLKESATQDRPDPLPDQLFGPIKKHLANLVSEKIQLLSAQGRAK